MKSTNEAKSKHTPGPWRTDGGNIWATWEDGQEVSLGVLEHTRWCGKDANCEYAKRIERETPANARLISAAPELLEACLQVLRASEDNGDMEDIDWIGLRAAVAKAEGRAE